MERRGDRRCPTSFVLSPWNSLRSGCLPSCARKTPFLAFRGVSFFLPKSSDPFALNLFGQHLDTPIGVAAGPHTQMAQNIIVAWLCGARFMELKTVQTLDDLEISKPCIEMQDEGYNVEWSQELKVDRALDEYVRAWVLIHALHKKLGLAGAAPGVIFNASVGYNLEGLLKPNMQWFLQRLGDVSELKARHIEAVAAYMPEVRQLAIPNRLSDNVTLSTMHGCPPGEIERIATYLINDRGLHTSVKLNPTLLGPEKLRGILNETLRFRDVVVPDSAFGHDLKYDDAVPMLRRLQQVAHERGVQFGVKLSNTLEVENTRRAFSVKEKTMYLSGRPLHALTVNLAATLQGEFNGGLPMSFSAGADALNISRLLSCGVSTVTVCTDLLKSGGYVRLLQYIENISRDLASAGAYTLPDYVNKVAARRDAGTPYATNTACGGDGYSFEPYGDAHATGVERDLSNVPGNVRNLRHYAAQVLVDWRYRSDAVASQHTKTERKLGFFDCIKAPCTDGCPTDQKVPNYMRLVAQGRFDDAVEVVRRDNPLPTILGRSCNHPCEHVCIRSHYDEPLAIREMKRFIMEREVTTRAREQAPKRTSKVAVLGAGPCGLSVAYHLTQAGYGVTLFESRSYAGGMVSGTIPRYRASRMAVEHDIDLIRKLGVEVRFNQTAGRDFTLASLKEQGFKYQVVATGAQLGRRLGIEGEQSAGVIDALEYLRSIKEDRAMSLGHRVGVIGGGDVAMDCARTAHRVLGSQPGAKVTIIYRRTIDEMPAAKEEVRDTLLENVDVVELAKPLKVVSEAGKVVGLQCLRMQLGERDASGRRRPMDVPGSEFVIELDTLLVAVSQDPALDFLAGHNVQRSASGFIAVNPHTFETAVPGLYAGGDVAGSGPQTIVKALGAGRRIAEDIRSREEGPSFVPEAVRAAETSPANIGGAHTIDLAALIRRRARRQHRVAVEHLAPQQRTGFEEVVRTLSEAAAKQEAGRCLLCDHFCSLCTSVCPNLAFFTYRAEPFDVQLRQVQVAGGHATMVAEGETHFRVRQAYQVAVLNSFCNECGNCATFCPTSGRPYQDKPRLYLNRDEFEQQVDNAFMLARAGSTWSIRGRFGGSTHQVELTHELVYRASGIEVRLDPKTLALTTSEAAVSSSTPAKATLSLIPCATMFALLSSLKASAAHMPWPQSLDAATTGATLC